MLLLVSQPGSRREQNKARTRRALIEAARQLARAGGLDKVTAEDIADRAGVSRRTFFNYFTGIDAVIAAGLAPALERIATALAKRPLAEHPLEAIAAALREAPIGGEILADWTAPSQPTTAQGQDLHLRVWKQHEQWLVDLLAQRLGEHDMVRVRTLAATVIAIFGVVQETWRSSGADVDTAATQDAFNAELVRAVEMAHHGWRNSPDC